MLTLDQLATFEHTAAAGILLAADPEAGQSTALLVIAAAGAMVAVITGRAIARLIAVIVETARLALRLAALLAGVLIMVSVSIMQLLPF